MKKEFKRKLEELGVFVIYLFGSKAIGKASRLSDIDIGVVLKESPSEKDTKALYQGLYGILSELYPPSKLDIVFLQTTPLSLQYFAIKEGKILFEKDPQFTADYEEFIVKQYLDFRPVLDFFDRVATGKYAEA
ncbi:MAG: nucleotidyltransferase domain-containing protein [Deltaproteobacteria bacterium]|nr:nucleotidyltransferase domain-containing protein [Deltaproteobacteria bacterium]MBM4322056.1 nucleotidyltransferase domain-containing protein [Deltaproteobacteria bacterium]MBM4346501.1 nucleotidyltransferase domain-containing protein [Deltaproteobacteria bacterium]